MHACPVIFMLKRDERYQVFAELMIDIEHEEWRLQACPSIDEGRHTIDVHQATACAYAVQAIHTRPRLYCRGTVTKRSHSQLMILPSGQPITFTQLNVPAFFSSGCPGIVNTLIREIPNDACY